MKKLILAIFVLFTAEVSTHAQTVSASTLSQANLPKGIELPGKYKHALQWEDKEGKHVLITCESGIGINSKFKHENEGRDAELWAIHYLLKDKPQQTWKIYDYVRDCPVDLHATFLPNTLQVTDIDKDGFTEVWIMYKTVCHGDVSPSDLKLIMMEAGNKHTMRGTTRIKLDKKKYLGGEYKADKAYESLSKEMKNFGVQLWTKNYNE
jgi:hypothetical protein